MPLSFASFNAAMNTVSEGIGPVYFITDRLRATIASHVHLLAYHDATRDSVMPGTSHILNVRAGAGFAGVAGTVAVDGVSTFGTGGVSLDSAFGAGFCTGVPLGMTREAVLSTRAS